MHIYQVLCTFRYYGVNDPVARKMMQRVDTLPKLSPPEDASITTLYIGGLTPVIGEDDIRDQFYSYGELQSVKKVCQKQIHLHRCDILSGALHNWRVIFDTFGASVYICAVACLVIVLPVPFPVTQQAGAPAKQSTDPACVMQIEHKQCAFVTFTSRQAAETAAEVMSNRLIIKGNRCRLLWGKPQEKRDAAAAAALSMLPSQVRILQTAHQSVTPVSVTALLMLF